MDLRKRLGEFLLRVCDAVDAVTEEKVRRCVESVTEEEVAYLNRGPSLLSYHSLPLPFFCYIRPNDMLYQYLTVPFENLQVRNPLREEMRFDLLTARLPSRSIRRKDAVPEKGFPVIVEARPFAVIRKLRREDGLEVFRIGREDATESSQRDLSRRGPRRAAAKVALEGLQVAIA